MSESIAAGMVTLRRCSNALMKSFGGVGVFATAWKWIEIVAELLSIGPREPENVVTVRILVEF